MPENGKGRLLRLLAMAMLVLALSLTIAACGDDEEEGGGAADTGGQDAGAAEPRDITMLLAFPAESAAWLPLHVAQSQGYFEDEGVNIETPAADGSGFVIQQLVGGSQDWGWAGAPSGVIGAATDPNLRVVACNQAKNIFTIQAVAGRGVQDVADLDGKKLGITEKGGGEEPMVMSVVGENDLDLEIVPLGEAGPAVIRALEDGTVDAFAGGITDIFTLQAGGIEFTDITPEKYHAMPGDCFTTTSDALESEENQDTAARVIRAWVKGSFFAAANPEAAVDIICEAVPEQCVDREGFTQPFVEQMIDLLQPLNEELPPNAIDVEGWETTAQVLADSGAIEEVPDIEALVNSPEVQAVTELAYENVDELQAQAEEDAAAYEPGG